MSNGSSNADLLAKAGILKQSLPAAHQRVIDELDPEHIRVLIDIKEKLEAADEEMQLKAAPAFTAYIIHGDGGSRSPSDTHGWAVLAPRTDFGRRGVRRLARTRLGGRPSAGPARSVSERRASGRSGRCVTWRSTR